MPWQAAADIFAPTARSDNDRTQGLLGIRLLFQGGASITCNPYEAHDT